MVTTLKPSTINDIVDANCLEIYRLISSKCMIFYFVGGFVKNAKAKEREHGEFIHYVNKPALLFKCDGLIENCTPISTCNVLTLIKDAIPAYF